MACLIFDLKIESALKFGRWLWGVHEDSLAVLTESYNSWARMLLGSSRWRSAEVCRGELGWEFCAPARVALEVAAVRHALWLQNGESLAGLCFAQAHLLQSNNWAKASLQLLKKMVCLRLACLGILPPCTSHLSAVCARNGAVLFHPGLEGSCCKAYFAFVLSGPF